MACSSSTCPVSAVCRANRLQRFGWSYLGKHSWCTSAGYPRRRLVAQRFPHSACRLSLRDRCHPPWRCSSRSGADSRMWLPYNLRKGGTAIGGQPARPREDEALQRGVPARDRAWRRWLLTIGEAVRAEQRGCDIILVVRTLRELSQGAGRRPRSLAVALSALASTGSRLKYLNRHPKAEWRTR